MSGQMRDDEADEEVIYGLRHIIQGLMLMFPVGDPRQEKLVSIYEILSDMLPDEEREHE